MIDVVNLALPFFGLIFVGFASGKLKQIPDTALAWMNFFIVYVSLPAFSTASWRKLRSNNWPRSTSSSPPLWRRSGPSRCRLPSAWRSATAISANSTIAGLAGGYGNIGYMGPGLALATLGSKAAVPVALIFCFDNYAFVHDRAVSDGAGQAAAVSVVRRAEVVKRVVAHPLVIATFVGILSAAIHFQPPVALDRLMQFLQNAAAPCALFTLGVTVALRPLKKMPWEVPFLTAVKLILHPVLIFLLLSLFGPFEQTWVYTAVLMAALPPALNVFVFARQYDTWVEQASNAVLLGTIVSVLTLTSVMWMVKTGTLPPLLFH